MVQGCSCLGAGSGGCRVRSEQGCPVPDTASSMDSLSTAELLSQDSDTSGKEYLRKGHWTAAVRNSSEKNARQTALQTPGLEKEWKEGLYKPVQRFSCSPW